MTEILWKGNDEMHKSSSLDVRKDIREKETLNKVKWWLEDLKQWILKGLNENLNPELESIRTDLIKFLSSDKFTLEDNNKLFNCQYTLCSPDHKNNKIAIGYRKVIDVLNLASDISVKDVVDTILKPFEDSNIPKIIKIKLAKHLKKNLSWYLTVNVGDGYVLDSWKWVEITNQLILKISNYNFDDYKIVSDPEWWEPICTNM